MIKILELFSGNADITKEFNTYEGVECKSLDYDVNKPADYHLDAYTLSDEFLSQFDFIWLSPDCTTYSLAGHGLHRKKNAIPVSDYAKQCDENNLKLVNQLKRLKIPFIMENPRGFFRHMGFTKGLTLKTVYYSTYGFEYTKPTDLFATSPHLMTMINDRISRGSRHLDYVCSSYENFLARCKMPPLLVRDICQSVLWYLRELQEVNYQIMEDYNENINDCNKNE